MSWRLDYKKLSPAPWIAHQKSIISPMFVGPPNDTGFREDDFQFMALARNAFDVMMRRKWYVVPRGVDDKTFWQVRHEGYDMPLEYVISCSPDQITDPFTALVEADKWYHIHIDRLGA